MQASYIIYMYIEKYRQMFYMYVHAYIPAYVCGQTTKTAFLLTSN